MVLPANIRLGWKSVPRTNTLAFYENPQITTVKSFIVHALIVGKIESIENTDVLNRFLTATIKSGSVL